MHAWPKRLDGSLRILRRMSNCDRQGQNGQRRDAEALAATLRESGNESIVESARHFARLMETQKQVSAGILSGRVGHEIEVLVDEVDEERAIARSSWDAPEIDGCVYINGESELSPGDMLNVRIEHADEYDLWGVPVRSRT